MQITAKGNLGKRTALASDGSYIFTQPSAALLWAVVDSTMGARQELSADSAQTVFPLIPWSAFSATFFADF